MKDSAVFIFVRSTGDGENQRRASCGGEKNFLTRMKATVLNAKRYTGCSSPFIYEWLFSVV